MITVVIPYYQKQAGVLHRALASIAAQHSCGQPVHVLIIDDASPAPVEPELAGITLPPSCTVQVITQVNGGPGAARNTGLNHAAPETIYLAFLDSDDEWVPDHLARATAALDAGFDFYFADHFQLNQNISAFARAGRIKTDQHPVLPGAPSGLHAYQGDMLDQIIRGNVIGTSTVVYSFKRFADQRFRVEFTNAGEDYLFWMELAYRGARIAFSSQIGARYGKGVNVYSGVDWGSEEHLLRVHNELKFKKITYRLFPVTAAQNEHILSSIRGLRVAFAQDLLHRISHRKKLSFRFLGKHLRMDPLSYFYLPLAFTKIFTRSH